MTSDKTQFAQDLRQWRTGQGISQAVAAQKLGIGIDTYRTWEQASRVPAPFVQAMVREKLTNQPQEKAQ